MKGMELPISTLVVIIVCIAVLLAVVMFFFGGYAQATKSVNLETARSTACTKLASMNCVASPETIQVVDFDADKDGALNNVVAGIGICSKSPPPGPGDNLAMLCKCYYGINIVDSSDTVNKDRCKSQVCNCG